MDAVVQEFAKSPIATLGALSGIISLLIGLLLSRQGSTRLDANEEAKTLKYQREYLDASIPRLVGS